MGIRNSIKRAEIYWVNLDPVIGHEIGGGKLRPVAVISIEAIHQNTGITMVVPGSGTKPRQDYPNVVAVDPDGRNGLSKRTFFQCHHVRAIDQERMTTGSTGRLSARDFDRVLGAVLRCLGQLP